MVGCAFLRVRRTRETETQAGIDRPATDTTPSKRVGADPRRRHREDSLGGPRHLFCEQCLGLFGSVRARSIQSIGFAGSGGSSEGNHSCRVVGGHLRHLASRSLDCCCHACSRRLSIVYGGLGGRTRTDRSRLKQAVVFGVLGTMILVSLFLPIWGIHGGLAWATSPALSAGRPSLALRSQRRWW